MMRRVACAIALLAPLGAACGSNDAAPPADAAPPPARPFDAGVVLLDAGTPVCGAIGELCCGGTSCEAPGACVAGRCALAADAGCSEGTVLDCCGVRCPVANDPATFVACVEGACRVTHKINDAGAPLAPSIAADDGNLYYTAPNANYGYDVVRAPLDGGAPAKLTEISIVGQLAISDTDVYVANFSDGIVRVPKDGGAATPVVSGYDRAFGVATDDAFVYFTANEPKGVGRAPLTGGGPLETIAYGGTRPYGVAVAAGRVVWTSGEAGEPGAVWSRDGDGGAPTAIASGLPQPTGVVADASHAYWVDFAGTNGSVHRAALGADAGGAELVASGEAGENIAIDDAAVYWTGARGVRRFAKGSGTLSTLFAVPFTESAPLTVHAGTVYWVDGEGAWSTTP